MAELILFDEEQREQRAAKYADVRSTPTSSLAFTCARGTGQLMIPATWSLAVAQHDTMRCELTTRTCAGVRAARQGRPLAAQAVNRAPGLRV